MIQRIQQPLLIFRWQRPDEFLTVGDQTFQGLAFNLNRRALLLIGRNKPVRSREICECNLGDAGKCLIYIATQSSVS